MKNIVLALICVTLFVACKQQEENTDQDVAQEVKISNTSLDRVEPPNWWIGLKDKSLQLLVKEDNIGNSTPNISYAGVTIDKVHKADSPNYLFIDFTISENTKAGKFDIVFKYEDGAEKRHTYELKEKIKPSEEFIGFNSSDAIFLITPDRFANGDESNDIVEGLNETKIDRTDGYARHGGDIQGIINHIDYIHELGFTSVWPTPVLTNDMHIGSYHGYAITDYYQVDPRFGTMDDYKNLAIKLRDKGISLIMDQVANHCGLEHWWMKDLPFNDWVNNQKYFEENKENWNNNTVKRSNHRRTTNQDMYASESDRSGNTDGWFVATMPDLNQRNPFMAKYIIQNSIWWIQTLELGGIRQDTYPYPDKNFMADWAGAIMNEYPDFSIVGEEWSYNPLLVAYWQAGNKNNDGYESNLKSTMDFPMIKAIKEGLNEEESWDEGLVKMYEGLANDFNYAKPNDIMVFMDNHDKSRVYTEFGEDIIKTKMAMGYILCLPRIAQVYYGTEILMNDTENPGDHGLIRTDFPGGWKGDKVNAFTGEGLTDEQKSMQDFMKKVLNYRKSSKAIHEGKTVHFSPFMRTYFLFRVLNDEIVVHIINKNDSPITLDLNRYVEIGLQGKSLKNIITNETFIWNDSIELKEKGSIILTTKLN
ncbi:glycoside hydrolase family 13 protein [Yeosuana sp. MJ-SS3]|uniref:Glycoside hydrolase family 13 protein n=1 Tax=Gilvirhabdus luticola TaxID=3079858 RepID=A0ABU3U3Y2_9FLAO|nr:glycoside hydrolase family 13 protein [Yeosuana sp. MJ-SS3]MDU8885125.1 glycoside hydrolase family 13 protein [Yeosuana sp. MJ-SS3]